MIRKILAVVLGIAAGMMGIMGVETIGHNIYPMPEGVDMNNPEAIETYITSAPIGALLFIILGWALGSFIAGIVSTLIAKTNSAIYAIICGVVLMMGGIAMLIMVPHPTWFWPLMAFTFVPMSWLGFRLMRKKN